MFEQRNYSIGFLFGAKDEEQAAFALTKTERLRIISSFRLKAAKFALSEGAIHK